MENEEGLLQKSTKASFVLPDRIPIGWMSVSEAEGLGYQRRIDTNLAIHRLDYSHPCFEFSTSNIKDEHKKRLRNTLSVTLEAPLLRLKFGFYSIVTTSIAQLSILPAALWLLVEITYLVLTTYGVLRYRYAKSWVLVISRFNTSLALVFLSLLTLVLAIDQTSLKNTKELPKVPEMPQFLGILAVMICLFIELFILLPKLASKIVFYIKKKLRKNDLKKEIASGIIIYGWYKKPSATKQ